MNNKQEIPSIEQSREAIDRIDREIVKLFCERMKVSGDVARYKQVVGKPITDNARERALLAKVSELAGPEMEANVRTLYASILMLSKAYQHELLNTSSRLEKKIIKRMKKDILSHSY